MPEMTTAYLKAQAPRAPEAEQALLGALILDSEGLSKLEGQITDRDFFDELHRRIFRAVARLVSEGKSVDPVTLHNELKADSLYQDAGGESYLASLAERVGSQAHLQDYGRIVREKAVLRELIRATTEIQEDCHKEEGRRDTLKATAGIAELLDRAETKIFRIAQERATSGFESVPKLIHPFMEKLSKAREQKAILTGLSTGYPKLDEYTMGLQNTDFVILAGRPGQGKTALALNIASHVSLDLKKPVAFFSLEMDKNSIMLRMLSAEARVDGRPLRRGYVITRKADGEQVRSWDHLTRAASKFLEADLYIDDSRMLSTLEVRSRARRLASELAVQGKKLSLIVIDYLQLLRFGEKVESRQQEVSEISRSLKALAKDLDVPVLALSQLSRRPEDKGREGGRPQLSDLRESGALEQDADAVLFVFREAMNRSSEDPVERAKTELIIGKQRNGPLGVVKMVFLEEYTRFEQEDAFAPAAPPQDTVSELEV